jgi:hypothetical protein
LISADDPSDDIIDIEFRKHLMSDAKSPFRNQSETGLDGLAGRGGCPADAEMTFKRAASVSCINVAAKESGSWSMML